MSCFSAFLCGEDRYTGQSFEHRRDWVEERLLKLTTVFTLDLAAYAVMSNHLHVVLHINAAQCHALTNLEVCQRWHSLYQGTLLSQRFCKGETLTQAEHLALDPRIAEWRLRLMSVSWFMRSLNEHIARLANAEDHCTGRFWEGRFKSQALLDEKAVIAAMAYVDLNPIRAKMAETPESSDHTSIQRRLRQLKAFDPATVPEPEPLYPFAGNAYESMPDGLAFRLADYVELVDWTGRQLHPNKRGAVPADTPLLLQRLDIEPEQWMTLTQQFEAALPA